VGDEPATGPGSLQEATNKAIKTSAGSLNLNESPSRSQSGAEFHLNERGI